MEFYDDSELAEYEEFENINDMFDCENMNDKKNEVVEENGNENGNENENENKGIEKKVTKKVPEKEIEKEMRKEKNNENIENKYLMKMTEQKQRTSEALQLAKINEDLKKYIHVTSSEEALKHFKEIMKNNGLQKKSNNRKEENEEKYNLNDMIDIDEEKLNNYLQSILKNTHKHDTMGRLEQKEGSKLLHKDKVEKEEKQKIFNFFKNMNVQIKLNDTKNCIGCGVAFQSVNKKKFGFLKSEVLQRIFNEDGNSDRNKILLEIYPEGRQKETKKLKETIITKTKETTEMDTQEVSEEDKIYLCERCYNLKNKNKIDDNLIVNSYNSNNDISSEDFEKYVINIFKKRCYIIYIVDVLDLYIYPNLKKLFHIFRKINLSKKKKIGSFYFCVNKIDLLKNYKEFTLKNYIYNFLRKQKIDVLFKNIFLVSAKTGHNIKKLIYTIYSQHIRAQHRRRQTEEEKQEKRHLGDIESLLKGNTNRIKKREKGMQENLENGENLENEEYVENENYEENEEYCDMEEYEEEEEEEEEEKNRFTNTMNYMSPSKKIYFTKNINIYTVGNANSGKSSFINYLIRSIKNKQKKKFLISKSIIPGTTLKHIQIKLNDRITITDTPGIISNGSLLYYLNFEELKYVVCNSMKTKIRSFYINENDFIFIGGLLYIHILKVKKYFSVLSFFMSDKISIIKRKQFSRDPHEYIREKIKKNFLFPPLSVERFDQINNFKEHHFNISNKDTNNNDNSYEVHIQGLGFITFYSFQNIEFKIFTLKNVDVVARESLMTHEKRLKHLDIVKSK